MRATEVVRQVVDGEGLAGTLFRPAGPGPYPAVVVLGGLDGGVMEGSAAALASEGFAALALVYFGEAGLPPELMEIPLEYFDGAVSWLAARPEVQGDGVALLGVSKGAELALLLGSRHPDGVRAVAGYVPSAVVYAGVSFGLRALRPGSSWTVEGEPVPFLKAPPNLTETGRFLLRRPVAFRGVYERPLEDPAAVAAAAIPVERIAGPVMLVSGTDDRVWPSTRLSEMVVSRLAAHGHPFAYRHLRYEGAGHIGGPYYASVKTRTGPMLLGGTLEANGAANADSWPEVVGFLHEHLG